MEETDLKAKLSYLKEIEPGEDWLILTRRRLLEPYAKEEHIPLQKRRFSGILDIIARTITQYFERPAFVMPLLAVMVSGGAVWYQAQGSLPGDTLYAVRAAIEEVPLRFSGEKEKPLRQIELAQRRLADLRIVAEQNKVKNLSPAIEAFESNVSEVSGTVSEIVENQPEHALQAGRGIVQLQKEKSEVEQILGTKIGEEQEAELTNATMKVVEYELVDLESRSLGEKQQILFQEAKRLAEEQKYPESLEIIWEIYNEG